MRDVNRHKSLDMLQAYLHDAELFRDYAGAARSAHLPDLASPRRAAQNGQIVLWNPYRLKATGRGGVEVIAVAERAVGLGDAR
jgi:hypothetical protein